MRRLLILSLLFLLCACGEYKKITVTLPDGFKVKADLADTPEKTEKGLMHRESLAENAGMLFAFDRNEPRVFWMKNTLISLDIIFINANHTVYSVAPNVPRAYVYTPDHKIPRVQGFGQYVLELPGGAANKPGVTEGAVVEFNIK
jgi:uncharacterized membrane protein (UPF0127 family)